MQAQKWELKYFLRASAQVASSRRYKWWWWWWWWWCWWWCWCWCWCWCWWLHWWCWDSKYLLVDDKTDKRSNRTSNRSFSSNSQGAESATIGVVALYVIVESLLATRISDWVWMTPAWRFFILWALHSAQGLHHYLWFAVGWFVWFVVCNKLWPDSWGDHTLADQILCDGSVDFTGEGLHGYGCSTWQMWPCPSVSSLNWWSRKRWLEQQRSYKKWESWGKPPQCVFTDNYTYIYHICYGFYGLICLNMLDLIEQLSWNRTGSQQSSHFTCGTVEVCEILCAPGQWEGRCCAAYEATLVPGLAKMNGWNLKIIPSWKWRSIYLYIQIT